MKISIVESFHKYFVMKTHFHNVSVTVEGKSKQTPVKRLC